MASEHEDDADAQTLFSFLDEDGYAVVFLLCMLAGFDLARQRAALKTQLPVNRLWLFEFCQAFLKPDLPALLAAYVFLLIFLVHSFSISTVAWTLIAPLRSRRFCSIF
jgi:hypothetical protein